MEPSEAPAIRRSTPLMLMVVGSVMLMSAAGSAVPSAMLVT
jgi:hypothetical protein